MFAFEVNLFYRYTERPQNIGHHLCLDYNEYRGAIHPRTLETLTNPLWSGHYPPLEGRPLETQMADLWGVNAEDLFVTNGADDGLFHLLWLLSRQAESRSFTANELPTYDHVLAFAEALSLRVNPMPWTHLATTPTATSESSKASRSGVLYLCNPNNPSGTIASPQTVQKILEEMSSGFVILDLTYAPFSRDGLAPFLELVPHFENLACVFSLAKCFPLAGVRMGVVITRHPPTKSYFSKSYNKKLVNHLARVLTKTCLDEFAFYSQQQVQIYNNRGPLADLISQYALSEGIEIDPVDWRPLGGNFVNFRGTTANLDRLVNQLLKKDVVIRTKPDWDFVRLTSLADDPFSQLKQILFPDEDIAQREKIRPLVTRRSQPNDLGAIPC